MKQNVQETGAVPLSAHNLGGGTSCPSPGAGPHLKLAVSCSSLLLPQRLVLLIQQLTVTRIFKINPRDHDSGGTKQQRFIFKVTCAKF